MAKWGACPKRAAAEELYDALAMVAAWLNNEAGSLSQEDEAKIYAALAKAEGASCKPDRAGGPSGPEPVAQSQPKALIPCALTDAIALACECHAGQTDKGGQPYILHPLRVMLRLDGENQRIAAVLHDTIEDSQLRLSTIRYEFGSLVADAVDALTRREGESYSGFIERCGVNDIARAVKWSDLCDNMDMRRLEAIGPDDLRRQAKYEKARDRLNALAIEAGTAATASGAGPQDNAS